MDRTAIFVDAGYLIAAGSRLLSSERLQRGDVHLDYEAILKLLTQVAAELTGLPLLRVYWYDGTSAGPTPQQLALAYRPSVKLRLGFVNQHGQQKGVDSLIVTDLINLARNRAMADAVLLTGDEDIRVGVQQAQELGVRVHLLGIAPARENQSGFLVQEADSVRELADAEVLRCLSLSTAATPSAPPPGGSAAADRLLAVAREMANELTAEERQAVARETSAGGLPAAIDRQLLVRGSNELGGEQLDSDQKRKLRSAFLAACRNGE